VGIINQASFKHEKPGVYTYTQDITPANPTLLVRYTIVGAGSNVQSPAGTCLVSFGPKSPATPPVYLKPYLIAAITSGNTTDVEEYAYPVTSSPTSNLLPG